MGRKLIVTQHIPFSVLFPEVHKQVLHAIVYRFRILQFRCVKPLLFTCAEQLTRYAVCLPARRGADAPFVDLVNSHSSGSEDHIKRVVQLWADKMSKFDDPNVVQAAYPEVFDFARRQILTREPAPCFFSDHDIAALVFLIIKNTNVFYKGKKGFHIDDFQTMRAYEPWFVNG